MQKNRLTLKSCCAIHVLNSKFKINFFQNWNPPSKKSTKSPDIFAQILLAYLLIPGFMDIFEFSVVIVRLPYSMSAIYLLSVEKNGSKLFSGRNEQIHFFTHFWPSPIPNKNATSTLIPLFCSSIWSHFSLVFIYLVDLV